MDPLCQEWVQQAAADSMKLQQLSPVMAKFHPLGLRVKNTSTNTGVLFPCCCVNVDTSSLSLLLV